MNRADASFLKRDGLMSYEDRHQNGGSLVELADDRDATEPADPMTNPWPSTRFASPAGPILPSSSLFDDEDDLDDFMGDPAGAFALAESQPEDAVAGVTGWSPLPLVASSFLPFGLTLGGLRPLAQDLPLPVASETTWSAAEPMAMASPPEVRRFGEGIASEDFLLADEVQALEVGVAEVPTVAVRSEEFRSDGAHDDGAHDDGVHDDAARPGDLFEADQAFPAAVVVSGGSALDAFASIDAPRAVPRPIASFVPLSFGASPASTSGSSNQDLATPRAPGTDVLTFSPSALRAAGAASAAEAAPATARRSLFGRGRTAGEATALSAGKSATTPKPAKTPKLAKTETPKTPKTPKPADTPTAAPAAESVPTFEPEHAVAAEQVIEAEHATDAKTATDITPESASSTNVEPTEPALETADEVADETPQRSPKQGIAGLFAKVDPTNEWKPESPKRAKTVRVLASVSLGLGLLIGGYALSQSTSTPSNPAPTSVAPSAEVPVSVATPTATDQLSFDTGGDFSFSEGGNFTVK